MSLTKYGGCSRPATCAAPPPEAVQVRYGGRVWTLTRPNMCKVPGSLPHSLFRPESQFLGNNIKKRGGVWVWSPADEAAAPVHVHAIIKFLAAPGRGRLPPPDADMAALARRWGLYEAMYG